MPRKANPDRRYDPDRTKRRSWKDIESDAACFMQKYQPFIAWNNINPEMQREVNKMVERMHVYIVKGKAPNRIFPRLQFLDSDQILSRYIELHGNKMNCHIEEIREHKYYKPNWALTYSYLASKKGDPLYRSDAAIPYRPVSEGLMLDESFREVSAV